MPAPKIAFSHYSSDKDISGVTTWLERLLVSLRRKDHQLVVLLHHFGTEVEKATILKPLRDAGIEVEIRSRARTLLEDVRDTVSFLNRHRPTIFVPQCLSGPHIAAAIAGISGLPWVMTIHSDDPEYWAIAETVRPEKCGGKIVGVSDHISQSATRRGLALNSETIPYGVVTCHSPTRFSNSPFRVVYAGRLLEQQKRISLVVDAMIDACRRDRRVECLIVGDGPDRGSCEKRVGEAGLGERIRFPGRLPSHDVPTELRRCQAVVLMSDFEGLPVSLLEAMTAGVVPVVRQVDSGIPELVQDGETGLVVNDQPESAATAILRLASDSALWEKCSRNAKTLVDSRFSEDQCHLRWEALLGDLCESSCIQYPVAMPKKLQIGKLSPLLVHRYPKPLSLGRRILWRAASATKRSLKLIPRGR